jgi:hypothetical protein
MFKVIQNGMNRLDIELSGKLDAEKIIITNSASLTELLLFNIK